MATNNVNAAPRRWNTGGTISFNDGTDDNNILNVEAGSLEITPIQEEVLEYADRGIQQTPLRGDYKLGMFKLEVKMVKHEANSLFNLAQKTNTVTSLALTYMFANMKVSIPDDRAAVTGTRFTATSVFFTEPPTYKAGERFDTVTVTGKFIAGGVTVSC